MDSVDALKRISRLHPLTLRQKMARTNAAHDLEREQDVLLRDIRIGDVSFLEMYRACRTATGTPREPAEKFLSRPLKVLALARYFQKVLEDRIPGGFVECGVFRGLTALMLSRLSAGRGELYLVDSFEGLSATGPHDDAVWVDPGTGNIHHGASGQRFEQTDFDAVCALFTEHPETMVLKGWIPDVFAQLPDEPWAFVHIDVDLHDPTRACLEHFWPRLSPGGVVLCDDYVTPLYPGAMRAMDDFCAQYGIEPLILDTGQAVLRKPAAA